LKLFAGKVYGKTVVAVAPQYTSQDCSNCGNEGQEIAISWDSLGLPFIGTELARDHNCGIGMFG
jgi:putative transposase